MAPLRIRDVSCRQSFMNVRALQYTRIERVERGKRECEKPVKAASRDNVPEKGRYQFYVGLWRHERVSDIFVLIQYIVYIDCLFNTFIEDRFYRLIISMTAMIHCERELRFSFHSFSFELRYLFPSSRQTIFHLSTVFR